MLTLNQKTSAVSCLALVLCLMIVGTSAARAQVTRPEFVPGELLVKVKDGTQRRRIVSILAGVDGAIVRRYRLIAALHVRVPNNTVAAAVSFSETVPASLPAGDYQLAARAEVVSQSFDEDIVTYRIE